MDSIRQSAFISASQPEVAPVKQEKDTAAAPPKDSVDVSSGSDKEAGFVHKMFRGLGKVVGGSLGLAYGTSVGALEGAIHGKVHTVSEKVINVARAAGALAGFTLGVTIAMAGMGPLGALALTTLGTVAGSTIGGAFPGAADGFAASVGGAAKEAYKDMKIGANAGGKVIDWIADHLPHKPDAPAQPAPAEPEQPKA